MYYPDILNLPQTGFNAKEKSMIIKPTELIGTVGFPLFKYDCNVLSC